MGFLRRILNKTRSVRVGENSRIYLNVGKGKAGAYYKKDGNTIHGGVNPASLAFIRAEKRINGRIKAYAYIKPNEAF